MRATLSLRAAHVTRAQDPRDLYVSDAGQPVGERRSPGQTTWRPERHYTFVAIVRHTSERT